MWKRRHVGDGVVVVSHVPFKLGQLQLARTVDLPSFLRVSTASEDDPQVGVVGYLEICQPKKLGAVGEAVDGHRSGSFVKAVLIPELP